MTMKITFKELEINSICLVLQSMITFDFNSPIFHTIHFNQINCYVIQLILMANAYR